MKSRLPPSASRYPQYLPYPQAIPMAHGPYPNATAINFPQGQFSPAYLRNSSFQPYNWNKRYEVLYTGGGNPYMTKTPRTQYGAMAHANPGCGCSAKTNPATDEEKTAWRSLAVGFVAGVAMYHAYLKAQTDTLGD